MQSKTSKPRNFVAKHMNQFNRAVTQKDKKRASKKGESKHKPKYF